jgi:hypothetical protein
MNIYIYIYIYYSLFNPFASLCMCRERERERERERDALYMSFNSPSISNHLKVHNLPSPYLMIYPINNEDMSSLAIDVGNIRMSG